MAVDDRAQAPREYVPLAPLTTLGVGGPARWFASIASADDLVESHRWSDARNITLLPLGGGSNVVVADDGFHGLVVRIETRGVASRLDAGDTLLTFGAGECWDDAVRRSVEEGLTGLECLSGIPGTVGGTPVQNVGAYGQEVAATIDSLTAYDRVERRMRALTAAECRFSYRTSRFKTDDRHRFVVCDVTFRLRPGRPTTTYPDIARWLASAGRRSPTVHDVRHAVLAVRRAKGMVLDAADPDTRSVGSFFMNPIVALSLCERIASLAGERPPAFASSPEHVKVPAAWLIERTGFTKGQTDGRVGISSKHPLALVNRGGASTLDVLRLAARIKRQVSDRFGVSLQPEPVFVGLDGSDEAKYLQNTES